MAAKVTNKQLLIRVTQLEGMLLALGQHLVQVQKYLGEDYNKFIKEKIKQEGEQDEEN